MALDSQIVGDNLDAGGNVKVALTNTPAQMGGVRMFSENDPGTATGSPLLRSPESSMDFRLRVGTDSVWDTERFNYVAQNTEGVTVNRWLSTGMLCASASSNETGYLTQKFSRALGMLAVDNQARV